jgi:hypothetical protein
LPRARKGIKGNFCDRIPPERRAADVAHPRLQHHFDCRVRGAAFLFASGHHSCGRVPERPGQFDQAPQFRGSIARIRWHARSRRTRDPRCYYPSRSTAIRVARNCSGSRPTGGTEAGAVSRGARDACLPGAVAWSARDGRGNHRGLWYHHFQRRICHGDRVVGAEFTRVCSRPRPVLSSRRQRLSPTAIFRRGSIP